MRVCDIDWSAIEDIVDQTVYQKMSFIDIIMSVNFENFVHFHHQFKGDIKDTIKQYMDFNLGSSVLVNLKQLLSLPEKDSLLRTDKNLQFLNEMSKQKINVSLELNVTNQASWFKSTRYTFFGREPMNKDCMDFFLQEGLLSEEAYLIAQFDPDQVEVDADQLNSWLTNNVSIDFKYLEKIVDSVVEESYRKAQEHLDAARNW